MLEPVHHLLHLCHGYARNLTVIINSHCDNGWLEHTLANGYNSWTYGSAANQKWTIAATSGGYHRLTPTHATNMAPDVNGVSTADGDFPGTVRFVLS